MNWARAFGLWLLPVSLAAEPASLSRGQAAFDRGDFAGAIEQWRAAAAPDNSRQQVESLVNQAAAYQALGETRSAIRALDEAVALAEKLPDRSALLLAKSPLGSA